MSGQQGGGTSTDASNGPSKPTAASVSSIVMDKALAPFSYAVAGILFLLGVQHLVGLRIESCKFTHDSWSCDLQQIEKVLAKKNDVAAVVFDEINKKIASLERRISAADRPSDTGAVTGPSGSAVSVAAVPTVNPNVPSDALTSYLQPIGSNPAARSTRAGVIFLGNHQDETSLSNLSPQGGSRLKFSELKAGVTYVTTANLTLRASMPKDTPEYFNAVPSVGVLPTGTVVKLTASNIFDTIVRGTQRQVWAEVQTVP